MSVGVCIALTHFDTCPAAICGRLFAVAWMACTVNLFKLEIGGAARFFLAQNIKIYKPLYLPDRTVGAKPESFDNLKEAL